MLKRFLVLAFVGALCLPATIGCSGGPGDVQVNEEARDKDFKSDGQDSENKTFMGNEPDREIPEGEAIAN